MAINGDPYHPRIIIHDDAFPLGSESEHGYEVTITFENFGEYCKCASLNFTICVGDCNDKNVEDIIAMLGANLPILNLIAAYKVLYVPSFVCYLPCDLSKSGDDPLQQIWMGLSDSCQKFLCKFCYAIQHIYCAVFFLPA